MSNGASIADTLRWRNGSPGDLVVLSLSYDARVRCFQFASTSPRRVFFSFEGIDGSGKSTQARLLAETLRQRGYEVVEVREPGGTPLGEAIRRLLLDPDREIDERAELLLFSAARAQLVAHVIRPALSRGAVVIADRFFDSSTAYQGGGRGTGSTELLTSLHQFATDGLSPQRTYLVNTPPELASQRREMREQDRMESGGEAFYSRVQKAYQSLAESARFMTLDGTESIKGLEALIERDATALLAR